MIDLGPNFVEFGLLLFISNFYLLLAHVYKLITLMSLMTNSIAVSCLGCKRRIYVSYFWTRSKSARHRDCLFGI